MTFAFIYTTQAKYDAAVIAKTINQGGLYFCSDSHRIYRGEELMAAQNVILADSIPEASTATDKVLYVVNTEGKYNIYTKVESEMVKVAGVPDDLDLSAFGADVISKSMDTTNASDDKLLTEKAIATYVEGIKKALNDKITENEVAFKDVAVGDPSDKDPKKFGLTFTAIDGSTKTVDLQKEAFAQSASLRKDTETGKTYLDIVVVNGDTISVDLTELIDVYDASNILTTDEITLTTSWGNLKAGDKISAKTDIQQVLLDALSKDINPTATAPKITSVTLDGAGAKEVGTKVTPKYTINLSNPFGSYSCQKGSQSAVASGCTASSYAVTDTNGGTATAKTGSFDEITVETSTQYSVSATCSYTQGNMPITFLGKEYPSVRIAAGTTAKVTSSKITGYRAYFYGTKTSAQAIADPTTITSAQVRALGKSGQTFVTSMTLPAGTQQVFFACPAGTYSSFTVKNSANQAPFGTGKVVKNVDVEGANGYTAAKYDVFYISNAGATSEAATFTIAFSK